MPCLQHTLTANWNWLHCLGHSHHSPPSHAGMDPAPQPQLPPRLPTCFGCAGLKPRATRHPLVTSLLLTILPHRGAAVSHTTHISWCVFALLFHLQLLLSSRDADCHCRLFPASYARFVIGDTGTSRGYDRRLESDIVIIVDLEDILHLCT